MRAFFHATPYLWGDSRRAARSSRSSLRGATILTAERIVRRLAERIAHSTLGVGHSLPTIAWGVADASGEPMVER
jgi:hypothetical protein